MSLDAPTEVDDRDASEFFVAIVAASYNGELVEKLIESAIETLVEAGLPEGSLSLFRVPGSAELPYVAYMNAMTGQFDVIIALGVVIAGDTNHHEIIAETTARSFLEIGFRTEIPVINGVITTQTKEQAVARCGRKINRGKEFALAALEMAYHKVALIERLDEIEEARVEAQKSAEAEEK